MGLRFSESLTGARRRYGDPRGVLQGCQGWGYLLSMLQPCGASFPILPIEQMQLGVMDHQYYSETKYQIS